jgi:hypothetical protein
MRMNATYAEISECVKWQFGFVPKTSWIAHVKELNGLRIAPSRAKGRVRQAPCPARQARTNRTVHASSRRDLSGISPEPASWVPCLT